VRHAENTKCFTCHGERKYTMFNKDSFETITRLMPSQYFIDTVAFYNGTHNSFKCSDCHSADYELSAPHNGELRFEAMPSCIDCHSGDPEYAKYHFEEIEEQVKKSVHIQGCSDKFSCWRCHDPHTYKSTAQNPESIKDLVAYNNAMCLKCHANSVNYMLMSEESSPNLIKQHEWLPNQASHFKSVRCIECHTALSNDSVLVAHQVLPKDKAVQKCAECHSCDSRLMHTLYKFKAKERRNEQGFFNGAILEESYVIGANRNYYLNVVSIAIFILVVGGIFIHAILRFTLKKKK
jgi:hypothetical protein